MRRDTAFQLPLDQPLLMGKAIAHASHPCCSSKQTQESSVGKWTMTNATLENGRVPATPLIAPATERRRMASGTDDRLFLTVSALLFIVSAAVTIVWCTSMSEMDGMAMPGGWTMSMMW